MKNHPIGVVYSGSNSSNSVNFSTAKLLARRILSETNYFYHLKTVRKEGKEEYSILG
ncbi:MAG: hypothetical protein ACXAB7_06835 [Candidatus Kariarchaeaceae archaeon]|jgi:hypothetical protein